MSIRLDEPDWAADKQINAAVSRIERTAVPLQATPSEQQMRNCENARLGSKMLDRKRKDWKRQVAWTTVLDTYDRP